MPLFLLEMCGNGFQNSQSLPFPQKVLPIPIPEIYTFEKKQSHFRIAPDNSFPFPHIPIPASTFRLIVGLP